MYKDEFCGNASKRPTTKSNNIKARDLFNDIDVGEGVTVLLLVYVESNHKNRLGGNIKKKCVTMLN